MSTRRSANRSHTYGYGRAEDLAGVAIVGLIFFSACVAGYQSVTKLIYGSEVSNVGRVAAAGVVGHRIYAEVAIKVPKELSVAEVAHIKEKLYVSVKRILPKLERITVEPLPS